MSSRLLRHSCVFKTSCQNLYLDLYISKPLPFTSYFNDLVTQVGYNAVTKENFENMNQALKVDKFITLLFPVVHFASYYGP